MQYHNNFSTIQRTTSCGSQPKVGGGEEVESSLLPSTSMKKERRTVTKAFFFFFSPDFGENINYIWVWDTSTNLQSDLGGFQLWLRKRNKGASAVSSGCNVNFSTTSEVSVASRVAYGASIHRAPQQLLAKGTGARDVGFPQHSIDSFPARSTCMTLLTPCILYY